MTAVNKNRPQKRLRLEVVIAGPPTQKCRATVAVMEEMTRRFPDLVRLDVYVWGQTPPVTTTVSYRAQRKYCRVPAVYINGRLVTKQVVPESRKVDARIREELAKGPEGWQE